MPGVTVGAGIPDSVGGLGFSPRAGGSSVTGCGLIGSMVLGGRPGPRIGVGLFCAAILKPLANVFAMCDLFLFLFVLAHIERVLYRL